MNIAKAASTSEETMTRTTPGTGARQMRRPPLTTTSRQSPHRSNHAVAARTTDGPPPSTAGTRCESAPVRSCAAKPITAIVVTRP